MSVFEGINYFCHDMLMLAPAVVVNKYILFYSILFYSILFHYILFYSILFYSILFYESQNAAQTISLLYTIPMSFVSKLLILPSKFLGKFKLIRELVTMYVLFEEIE